MAPQKKGANEEKQRLEEDRVGRQLWRKWGPYLSERQWGTVREDYSAHGTAWDYLPHDHARSRAYRWGEDGLAGISDEEQRLCLSLALWNERDPILKERLFGLTNSEGNHGEDVKEVYYYLDAMPTHSYLKMLYKYPQPEFPYSQLVEENRRRGKDQPEYELLDTGVFDDDRYFDIFAEYAKAGPEDLLMQVTVHNRGPEEAVLHLLPQIWFRNTWSWKGESRKPWLAATGPGAIEACHPDLGKYTFYAEGDPALLFCDNETNVARLYGANGAKAHYKDSFHDYVVKGDRSVVNQNRTYALTSYGGNGGSRSFDPSVATTDGVFHTTGPGSQPSANQVAVGIADLLDGTGGTLLFGERSHWDPNYDSFAAAGLTSRPAMGYWGWWAASEGRLAIGDVTLSAYSPINYSIPFRAGDPGAPTTSAQFKPYEDQRVCAFGSSHPVGANFALADGSVRFVAQSTAVTTLRQLATRAGGEVVGDY
jgi:prepilin-type processing-associated H-X9-DG protein